MKKVKRTMRKKAKSMRKAAKRTMRKVAKRTMHKSTKSKSVGKKKGKKKLSDWNKRVMMVYRSLKKSNPDAKLGDAMKAAAKNKNKPLSMSVEGGGPSCGTRP